jgi:hypothetical protein
MELLIVHEKDLQDKEEDVIGVVDSIENAESIIKQYYGEFTEISKKDIRDSTLEYSKVLKVKSFDDSFYEVEITLQWFTLNCA